MPKPAKATPTTSTKAAPTTPKRAVVRQRPASEAKAGARRRSCRAEATDSDEDFLPVSGRGRRVASQSQDSSSSEGSEVEVEPVVKRGRKAGGAAAGLNTAKRVFRPSVAPRAAPLSASADPLAEAQQRLHVSAVPDSLPCREEEFAEVFSYVESKLRSGDGGCYYISGVPGTGKTATVMEAVRLLEETRDDYPEFNFYSMNGMRLTSPEQAYVEMWRLLTGEKATPEHAMKLLEERFSRAAPKRVTSIFLVDELDMLCNRKQSVLYNIFDWPSRPEGKLIVIAIANTMDLPERVMINRVSSRLGLTRQTFQPYTHGQLQAIVASRLEGLHVFQQDAVQLVARKVASLSGDARRALDICRRATELAEAAGETRIGLRHVTAAYQEMFTSPKIQAIRCGRCQGKVLPCGAQELQPVRAAGAGGAGRRVPPDRGGGELPRGALQGARHQAAHRGARGAGTDHGHADDHALCSW
jgi:origin recognition complex subunit 1